MTKGVIILLFFAAGTVLPEHDGAGVPWKKGIGFAGPYQDMRRCEAEWIGAVEDGATAMCVHARKVTPVKAKRHSFPAVE